MTLRKHPGGRVGMLVGGAVSAQLLLVFLLPF